MGLKARDVMQTGVITVQPDASLLDVYRLFVEDEINGAPVVDENARVVGVITSSDLLRSVEEERDTAAAESTYFSESFSFGGVDWVVSPADFQERLAEHTVADAMTAGAIAVDIDDEIPVVASALHKHRIHRVLVCDQGELVGVITTFDLVRLLIDSDVAR
ncbi:MAG: CBS domain-containing protein [Deltaproteobacteria bacterium]|nr:MAG: CBS domain-containing protein [Deltaproteobacteria bacterium]